VSVVVVGHCLVECGETGADVVSVRDAEVGVEGERLLPVVAGEVGLAGGAVSVGESVVGTGLFVAVDDLSGQGESGGVLDECLAKLSGDVLDLTEVVEGAGFAGRVADLSVAWLVHRLARTTAWPMRGTYRPGRSARPATPRRTTDRGR
jgi:hypothetical protein